MKNLIAFIAAFLLASSATAATIPITPGTGANVLAKQDGSGNYAPSHTLCDATNPVNCAPVSATAGLTVNGSVAAPVSLTATNPTSTLTLPSTTTPYAAGQLVANSATGGSVVVPSFAIANSAGAVMQNRVRLSTNDNTAAAWAGVGVQVDEWVVAPTFTTGDRSAFVPLTGAASHVASFVGNFATVTAGDGVYAELVLAQGSNAVLKLASGTTVYWTLQIATGSATGTTGASKVMTLIPELLN